MSQCTTRLTQQTGKKTIIYKWHWDCLVCVRDEDNWHHVRKFPQEKCFNSSPYAWFLSFVDFFNFFFGVLVLRAVFFFLFFFFFSFACGIISTQLSILYLLWINKVWLELWRTAPSTLFQVKGFFQNWKFICTVTAKETALLGYAFLHF